MTVLVHGTALVVGNTGLILLGPSGSGKSTLAMQLIFTAEQAGHFAALLSDDQVLLEAVDGHVLASAPHTIKGMIELRGSGIGRMKAVDHIVLHFAVSIVTSQAETRIPEENQFWAPAEGMNIPLYFLDRLAPEPFASFSALISGFPIRY